MTIEETAAVLNRESTITRIADHISNAVLAQKFLCDALHDLAADNHDGVWTSSILSGLDALRQIAGVVQGQNADLWPYGSQDVPF